MQLVEQRLDLFQFERIDTLGEPVVDRRRQIRRPPALAAPGPEEGEIAGGAQFERALLMPPRGGFEILASTVMRVTRCIVKPQ